MSTFGPETKQRSQAVAGTREDATDIAGCELVDDGLDAGVCAHSEEEDAGEDDSDVESGHHVADEAVLPDELDSAVRLSHAEVGDTPEDEPEEAIKEGGHEREN